MPETDVITGDEIRRSLNEIFAPLRSENVELKAKLVAQTHQYIRSLIERIIVAMNGMVVTATPVSNDQAPRVPGWEPRPQAYETTGPLTPDKPFMENVLRFPTPPLEPDLERHVETVREFGKSKPPLTPKFRGFVMGTDEATAEVFLRGKEMGEAINREVQVRVKRNAAIEDRAQEYEMIAEIILSHYDEGPSRVMDVSIRATVQAYRELAGKLRGALDDE